MKKGTRLNSILSDIRNYTVLIATQAGGSPQVMFKRAMKLVSSFGDGKGGAIFPVAISYLASSTGDAGSPFLCDCTNGAHISCPDSCAHDFYITSVLTNKENINNLSYVVFFIR